MLFNLVFSRFYAFFFYDLYSPSNFEIFLFLSTDENSNIDIGAI